MVKWDQLKIGTPEYAELATIWILDRDALYEYVLTVTDQRKLTRTDKKNANDMWKRYLI
jgi:hypothetical protein